MRPGTVVVTRPAPVAPPPRPLADPAGSGPPSLMTFRPVLDPVRPALADEPLPRSVSASTCTELMHPPLRRVRWLLGLARLLMRIPGGGLAPAHDLLQERLPPIGDHTGGVLRPGEP